MKIQIKSKLQIKKTFISIFAIYFSTILIAILISLYVFLLRDIQSSTNDVNLYQAFYAGDSLIDCYFYKELQNTGTSSYFVPSGSSFDYCANSGDANWKGGSSGQPTTYTENGIERSKSALEFNLNTKTGKFCGVLNIDRVMDLSSNDKNTLKISGLNRECSSSDTSVVKNNFILDFNSFFTTSGGITNTTPSVSFSKPSGTYAYNNQPKINGNGVTSIRWTRSDTSPDDPNCTTSTIYDDSVPLFPHTGITDYYVIKAVGCTAEGVPTEIIEATYTITPDGATTIIPDTPTIRLINSNSSTGGCWHVDIGFNETIAPSIVNEGTNSYIARTIAEAIAWNQLTYSSSCDGVARPNYSVVVTSNNADTVRYTLDGSNPTCSTGHLLNGSGSILLGYHIVASSDLSGDGGAVIYAGLKLSGSQTIKAIGCSNTGGQSAVFTSPAYTLNMLQSMPIQP